MRRLRTRSALGAALLVASWITMPAACGAAASAQDSSWEVLVPAGRVGRFGLRVERAEFTGPVSLVEARIAQAWSEEPWPMLGDGAVAAPSLSRLTPTGIETVSLRPGPHGGVQARRSILDWRDPLAGVLPASPEPVFVAALSVLGEPLAGLASIDPGAGNLTRVWLAPGEVDAVSRQVEGIAASHGLAPLLRFDAPADAREPLRGGRVLAFGGAGVVAVVTFTRQAAGVAVVVHCQERLP